MMQFLEDKQGKATNPLTPAERIELDSLRAEHAQLKEKMAQKGMTGDEAKEQAMKKVSLTDPNAASKMAKMKDSEHSSSDSEVSNYSGYAAKSAETLTLL